MFYGRKKLLFIALVLSFGIFFKIKNGSHPSQPNAVKTIDIATQETFSSGQSSSLRPAINIVSDVIIKDAPKPVLKLKAGSGPNQLGISDENTLIGPGMIKRSGNSSYLISDTFNNRILKVSKDGEQELEINFSESSLLQGFAENSRGDIWSLRREGSELFLDKFNPNGHKMGTSLIQTQLDEFKNYAGTFRTFFSNGEFYISGSQRVLKIESDGKTKEVPGIPLETQKGVYISARQDSEKRFIVDLKDSKSKNIKSFYASGSYQSLKNIFSDNKGQIHLEFEHTFESTQNETGEKVSTQAAVIETFSEDGKFIKEDMFEKNSDAEIDQSIDIDENGNLDHIVLRNSDFEFYERMS